MEVFILMLFILLTLFTYSSLVLDDSIYNNKPLYRKINIMVIIAFLLECYLTYILIFVLKM